VRANIRVAAEARKGMRPALWVALRAGGFAAMVVTGLTGAARAVCCRSQTARVSLHPSLSRARALSVPTTRVSLHPSICDTKNAENTHKFMFCPSLFLPPSHLPISHPPSITLSPSHPSPLPPTPPHPLSTPFRLLAACTLGSAGSDLPLLVFLFFSSSSFFFVAGQC